MNVRPIHSGSLIQLQIYCLKERERETFKVASREQKSAAAATPPTNFSMTNVEAMRIYEQLSIILKVKIREETSTVGLQCHQANKPRPQKK